jgi:hypothetical protein
MFRKFYPVDFTILLRRFYLGSSSLIGYASATGGAGLGCEFKYRGHDTTTQLSSRFWTVALRSEGGPEGVSVGYTGS